MLEHPWDLASVDFPLNEDSVVFEIGGYVGRWVKEIADRFHPNLYVFEPQPWAWKLCKESLRGYPHTHVENFALGTQSGVFPMTDWETDGCTFARDDPHKPAGEGKMIDMVQCLELNFINKIDLCLMNIEGYEFTLIPYMIEHNIFDKITYFMCQFHTVGAEQGLEYIMLKNWLGHFFHTRWDFGKTLTCWEKK